MDIIRLEAIIEMISIGPKKKSEIASILEEKGLGRDARTIQRDLAKIEESYELKRGRNGVQIVKKLESGNKMFNALVSTVQLQRLFEQNEYLDHIIDYQPKERNFEIIPDLLRAIDQKRIVLFNYKKHGKEVGQRKSVIPLKIREDQGRWYLAGVEVGTEMVKYFGMDRMHQFCVGNIYKDKGINWSGIQKQLEMLKNKIGVSYPTFDNAVIEHIFLEVSDFLIPYWRSKPVHKSQYITEIKKNGFTQVHLKLIPNIDLVKLIYSQVGDVRLIGPKHLKEYIKSEYKNKINKIIC